MRIVVKDEAGFHINKKKKNIAISFSHRPCFAEMTFRIIETDRNACNTLSKLSGDPLSAEIGCMTPRCHPLHFFLLFFRF